MTTTINASNSGSGGLVQTADASGILALQTAGTTAVTISAAQVVTFANPPTGVFPAGTALLFQQTAAPTGWTKVTTYNDYALRVVNGSTSTGGSVAFSTAFASQAVSGSVGTSGATTLTTGQIPNHYHSVYSAGFAGNLGVQPQTSGGDGSWYGFADVPEGTHTTGSPAGTGSGMYADTNNGGGGSHTHSGGTFTGTAINLAVQYVDVIIATKN